MRPFTTALLRAAVVLAIFPAPLAAQVERQTLDSIDVPVLAQAIRAFDGLTRWQARTYPDPLEFIRRHAKFAVAPPAATYELQCSADIRTACSRWAVRDTTGRARPRR